MPMDSTQNADTDETGAVVAPVAGTATDNHKESNIKPHHQLSTKKKQQQQPIIDENNHQNDSKILMSATANDEWELVPPDGGWGWLVLGGAMLVNILIPGTIKSFGVLFVEFLEAFDATPSAAAWIPALCYFLYSSLGPISSIMSVKYSYRTVTVLGGAFASVGMMLTFWASSVSYLYISYGVCVGIGAGLAFPPTVYIVTSYFMRFRGLANGLCISGSALGSIILPPVLRFLLDEYGYRGSVLIMGAVTLNVWVAAIFYQPVENHFKRVPKHLATTDDEDDEDNGIVLEMRGNNAGVDTFAEEPPAKPKFMITSDETPVGTPKFNKLKNNADVFAYTEPPPEGFARSVSAVAVPNYNHSEHKQRKISAPAKKQTYPHQLAELSSTPSLAAAGGDGTSIHSKFYRNSSRMSNARLSKRSPSTSSFHYISTPYHGSTLSTFQPAEFASHLSLKSITSNLNPVGSCKKRSTTGVATTINDHKATADEPERNKFFDLTLLRDPVYLVILISNCTNAIGYTNFIILLPSYAITMNFDKSLAAYLISTVSALDLVGRIGGSALSDTGLIPKTWYFVGGLAISGISLSILPLARTYTLLSVCCAFFGLASGVYVGVTAVIMADMLGTDRLTSTYGISLFVNGILQLIGPPICGVVFENLGTYRPIFMTLGLILLSGAALWGFMPYIQRQKKREAAERRKNVEAQKKLLNDG